MPLQIWLKEPQVQLLIAGDRIVEGEWRGRKFGLFRRWVHARTDGGDAVMFRASSVLMVRTVTDDEVKELKAAMEAVREGKRVQPSSFVPGLRRAR